jgi:hypothetical protein
MNIDTEREPSQQVIVPVSVSVSRQDNHGAGSCSGPTLIEMLEQDTVDGSRDADDDGFEIAGPEAMNRADAGEDPSIKPDHAPLAPMQEATSRSRSKFGCSDHHQQKFTLEVCDAIDAGKCEELFFSWDDIKPTKPRHGPNAKKVKASDCHISAVAMWLPHKLVPGCSPCCPKRSQLDRINLNEARWISQLMVLLTLGGHKILDTQAVPCERCNHCF